jgi:hypothetical protein
MARCIPLALNQRRVSRSIGTVAVECSTVPLSVTNTFDSESDRVARRRPRLLVVAVPSPGSGRLATKSHALFCRPVGYDPISTGILFDGQLATQNGLRKAPTK